MDLPPRGRFYVDVDFGVDAREPGVPGNEVLVGSLPLLWAALATPEKATVTAGTAAFRTSKITRLMRYPFVLATPAGRSYDCTYPVFREV